MGVLALSAHSPCPQFYSRTGSKKLTRAGSDGRRIWWSCEENDRYSSLYGAWEQHVAPVTNMRMIIFAGGVEANQQEQRQFQNKDQGQELQHTTIKQGKVQGTGAGAGAEAGVEAGAEAGASEKAGARAKSEVGPGAGTGA